MLGWRRPESRSGLQEGFTIRKEEENPEEAESIIPA
jgi:hypothetical protein